MCSCSLLLLLTSFIFLFLYLYLGHTSLPYSPIPAPGLLQVWCFPDHVVLGWNLGHLHACAPGLGAMVPFRTFSHHRKLFSKLVVPLAMLKNTSTFTSSWSTLAIGRHLDWGHFSLCWCFLVLFLAFPWSLLLYVYATTKGSLRISTEQLDPLCFMNLCSLLVTNWPFMTCMYERYFLPMKSSLFCSLLCFSGGVRGPCLLVQVDHAVLGIESRHMLCHLSLILGPSLGCL